MSSQSLQKTTTSARLPLHHEHTWEISPREAVALQRSLAAYVRIEPLAAEPKTIAGVDVSVRGNLVQAAVVLLDAETLSPVAQAVWRDEVRFPYVSGLLSFREIPAVLAALEQLPSLPDLIMCDGQGIAHPRRIGLASHLGVLLDLPTVGAAKSRLIGVAEEPPMAAGSWTPLRHHEEIVGAVLRTRTGVKPMYVSPGHRVTLGEAMRIVLQCVTRYRMPEPTRLAHLLSRAVDVPDQVLKRKDRSERSNQP